MERIPGESLAERLGRLGRLSEPEVRALGAALADGMQAAHDGGIVHRDLKPANVMLRGDQPTVVDFGLARDLGGRSAVETGRRAGTPAYMAPEQLTGGLIAPCVDIWALGVILFEARAGRLPFEGFADGRCPQLFEVAPRLASLVESSAELDAVVAACLERAPGRRPASMAAVARALRGEGDERITQDAGDRVTTAGEAAAAPEAGARRSSRAIRRGLWVSVAAAVVALALLATGGAGSDRDAATDVVGAGGAVGQGAETSAPARSSRAASGAAAPGPTAVSAARSAVASAPAAGSPSASPAGSPSASPAGSPSAPSAGSPSASPAGSPSASSAGSPSASSAGSPSASSAGSPSASPAGSPSASSAGSPSASSAGSPAPSAPLASSASAAPTASAHASAAGLDLEIRSTPPGADVLVDGERRGRTPTRLHLAAPGSILLRKRGHAPARVRVHQSGLIDVRLSRRTRAGKGPDRAAKPPRPGAEGLD